MCQHLTSGPDGIPSFLVPDLVTAGSLEKKMYVIEIPCPGETIIPDKEYEEIRKNEDLMNDFKHQRIRDHLHSNNNSSSGRNETQHSRVRRKSKNN
ncbi:hypothetical protein Trydic_g2629 [Trypoxylus dichotomus]